MTKHSFHHCTPHALCVCFALAVGCSSDTPGYCEMAADCADDAPLTHCDLTGSVGGVKNNCTVPPASVADAGGIADASVTAADGMPGTSEMVTIAAGTFTMGCDSDGDGSVCTEEPTHQVSLTAFEIDRREASIAEYKACIAAGVCSVPNKPWLEYATDDFPAHALTWQNAVDFCAWQNKRLPTEAEWEKAARGTDARLLPWGNVQLDPDAPRCDLAMYGDCLVDANEPFEGVAENDLGASPYGAVNMAGNVEEWVSDWWSATYYENSPASDPTGPATGTYKVARGGWGASTWNRIRASARVAYDPGAAVEWWVGVRCARSL